MPVAPDGSAYELIGPEDAPCVVLIHGLGLNRACWQWTSPALVAGYRVLSYDLYGHGQSVDPPETPSLTLFSLQLQGLLDHRGIADAVIVGFSLGGMIARRFAQDCPDRARAGHPAFAAPTQRRGAGRDPGTGRAGPRRGSAINCRGGA